MTYAEAFMRTYFGGRPVLTLSELILEHRRVMLEIEEAEARQGQPVVQHNGEWVPITAEIGPVAPPIDHAATESAFERLKAAMQSWQVSTKCTECGLDGNHDTWCPHWRPYVADES